MDPIHPILPTAAQPPAVDRVRRLARAGDDRERGERRPRREQPRGPAPAPEAGGPPVVTPDGHLDTRA